MGYSWPWRSTDLGCVKNGSVSLHFSSSLPLPSKQLHHQHTTICRQEPFHHQLCDMSTPSKQSPGTARSLASCSSYLSCFSCLSSSCLFHALSVCLPLSCSHSDTAFGSPPPPHPHPPILLHAACLLSGIPWQCQKDTHFTFVLKILS